MIIMKKTLTCLYLFIFFFWAFTVSIFGQNDQTLLLPDQVFDGQNMQMGWAVLIENDRIKSAGPAKTITTSSGAKTIELPGCTLMPGLIEGHSHLLLHPYNETSWTDQVLKESEAERAG